MRVLLDEMLDRRLKQWLPEGVEVVTVRERGWDSKKNGELLTLAEKEFDVLLTTDRGIPHQQDLSLRPGGSCSYGQEQPALGPRTPHGGG